MFEVMGPERSAAFKKKHLGFGPPSRPAFTKTYHDERTNEYNDFGGSVRKRMGTTIQHDARHSSVERRRPFDASVEFDPMTSADEDRNRSLALPRIQAMSVTSEKSRKTQTGFAKATG